MKKVILLVVFGSLFSSAMAQTAEQTMEKRAREMHRVISLSDKAEWRKFISENYTKALIEKPMKAKVTTQDEGSSVSATNETSGKGTVDDKVGMFERLHNDFGGSKIVSIKTKSGTLEMELSSDDLTGVFKLKFDKNKPYLIDGLGIEVQSK